MVFFAAFAVFSVAVAAMSIGVALHGRELSGSCGGVAADGSELGDCLCARKDNDLCASEPGNEIVALAELGYPRRKDHGHHDGHPSRADSDRDSGFDV